MAFTALMTLLNYESKVVAEGNHSWSELHIPMKLTNGTLQSFRVRVDNTFDDTKWFIINQDEVSEWKKYYGNTNQCAWYNKKAKSDLELKRIKNHIASNESMEKIEKGVVQYLKNKIL
jgi:hypothetical protein